MRKYFVYTPLICIVFFLLNCADINDIHDVYLENGETIYIAKVDSVDAFSGDQRVLLRLYTKNPMITTLAIFWDQKVDSLIVPVQNRVSPEYFDVLLGKNSKTLSEKSYVFEIFSRDGKGHRSVKYEQIAEVYGDRYRSTLQNHYYKSAVFNSLLSTLTITWFASIDKTESAVEFNYQDKVTGKPTIRIINVGSLGSTTQLINIDSNYPVSYRTLFLPTTTAIDTFYTSFKGIVLK